MDDIRVILADDHQMVRQGLAQVIEDTPGIRVVGQASVGEEALRLAAENTANVMVLDYGLPDIDGAGVTTRLRRDHPELKVLILTVHDNIHYVIKAMDAGAQGFVVKSDAVTELVRAIRDVHEGKNYISPRLSDKFSQAARAPRGRHIGLDKLSQREFELLRLMGQGMSLQECAHQMQISESTASTYRARLMAKLELQNTAQIIRFALEHGVTG